MLCREMMRMARGKGRSYDRHKERAAAEDSNYLLACVCIYICMYDYG